jgi:multiple sugar transport system permease protein
MMSRIKKHPKKGGFSHWLAILVLTIFVISALFPSYWMVISSFKSKAELFSADNPLWFNRPTIAEYVGLFELTPFFSWFINTIIVAGGATAISIIFGGLAAYGISRTPSILGIRIAQVTLLAYLIPRAMFAVPFYILLNSIGLLNTLFGLTLSYITFTMPFAIWMLLGFFEGIPKDLDEQARVDGCSRVGTLVRIILPLTAPGLVATAIFCMSEAWNEFLYPLALLQTQEKTVLTSGIASLQQGDVFAWGQIMAAGVLTTLPIMILFMLIYRRIVGGLAAGAVKG